MYQLYLTAILSVGVMMDCFIVAYCTETKGMTHIKIVNIFRRVRKIAKSDY